MTLLFIVSIASAVARGLNVECGCFGTVGGRKVGLAAIAEDAVLLVMGLFIVWQTARGSQTASAVPANGTAPGPP
jgi:hypothetical protein